MTLPAIRPLLRLALLRLALPLLLWATAAGLAVPVAASTVLPMDLAQLTERAERVFLGRCVAAHPAVVEGRVVTRLTFAVEERLKGEPAPQGTGDTLRVLLPGGDWEGRSHRVSGMPEVRPGDELVLFLSAADALGRVWPIGLGQGGFHVERDDAGPARVRQDLDGLHRLGGSAKPAGAAPPATLDTLLDRVRALAGSKGGAR